MRTCMNTQTTCVFVHLARISALFVCVPGAPWSPSVSLIFTQAPQWSRCLWSQPPAPQHRPEPRSLLLMQTHTHTAPAPRSSDMVSECVRPVDGGRLCLHEGKYKRREVGSPANMCIRSKRWTILYPRPAGCQREAAIHKSA